MANISIPPLIYVQLKSALIQIKEETNSPKKLAWVTGLLDQLAELEVTEPIVSMGEPQRPMPAWAPWHAINWFEGFTWLNAFTSEELHRITKAIPDFGDRETFTAREAYELIYAIRRGLCHEEPESTKSTAHFGGLESPQVAPLASPNLGQAGASPPAGSQSGRGGDYYEVSDKLCPPKHNPYQQTRE